MILASPGVEVNHTYLAVIGLREIQNDLNVVPEGGDTGGGDVVSQEVELGDGEHELLQVEGQPIGSEDGEQRREVALWSCCILRQRMPRTYTEKSRSPR
jgi:hypothetical protein